MSRITVADVLAVVAIRYGVTREELKSPIRCGRVRWPRAIAYWLSRRLTGQSLPQIGRCLSRDHSVILYGVRRMDRLRADSPDLARELAGLEAAVRAYVEDPASVDEGRAGMAILGGRDDAAGRLARDVLMTGGRILGRSESLAICVAYLQLSRATFAEARI